MAGRSDRRLGRHGIGGAAGGAHASTHILGSADEVDGDRVDIDLTPAYYTPDSSPAVAGNVDHLAAHLAGIDNRELSEERAMTSLRGPVSVYSAYGAATLGYFGVLFPSVVFATRAVVSNISYGLGIQHDTSIVVNNATSILGGSNFAYRTHVYHLLMPIWLVAPITNVRGWFGLTATGNPANLSTDNPNIQMLGLRYSTGVSGNWYLYYANSAASFTAVNTGLAVAAATWYLLEIWANGTQFRVRLWTVGRVLAYDSGVITSAVPNNTVPMRQVSYWETLDAVVKSKIDTWAMYQGQSLFHV